MSSASAFSKTLQAITATRVQELSKQRAVFEQRREEIRKATEDTSNLQTKAQVLLKGIACLHGYPQDDCGEDAHGEEDSVTGPTSDTTTSSSAAFGSHRAVNQNLRRFLLQNRYDPSVTENLKPWIQDLERELQILEIRYQHSSFYCDLVTENLSTLNVNEDTMTEAVGRKEMYEQRAEWESLVFTTPNINPQLIQKYLQNLFEKTKTSQQALKELRASVKGSGKDLAIKSAFTVDVLGRVAKILLKSDLLTPEKASVLKEFVRNKEVAREVVGVLNMRLASLDSWEWDHRGIPLEMRRQLSGKYRVFMDADILDSILFQHIGMQWCVIFKKAFKNFQSSPAWRPYAKPISKQDRERREYFLGKEIESRSVNSERILTYQEDYFMSQLPGSIDEGTRGYDDDDDDDDDNENEASNGKNPLEIKHSLLHLLVTESIIHRTLRGNFTAIRSDFKWFGPSLPHCTILAVMEFFGVENNWLKFFENFLKAPLRFIHDGPGADVQARKRGVPMSYFLSTCCGEVVLFCMDYAVNQEAGGAFLYRLHDDFWFWGEEEKCVNAWRAMSEFAKIMGLEFNEEKTGTVQMKTQNWKPRFRSQDELASPSSESVSPRSEHDTESKDINSVEGEGLLPKGDIRWGFLKLDPEEGRFLIDQEQVDTHIDELRLQLAACKSVFSWVKAWNSYFARFFSNNFVKPAMCFGRDHIDMVVSTLNRIERELFAGIANSPDNVTDYLRNMIAQRFQIYDLPAGFFYFPVEVGGLGLRNPHISFLAMRDSMRIRPESVLEEALHDIELKYHSSKQSFERNGSPATSHVLSAGGEPAVFLSLEEYTRYLENSSSELCAAYNTLTCVPDEISPNMTPEVSSCQARLRAKLGISRNTSAVDKGITFAEWNNMTPYWRWVAELYHTGMIQKYGGLDPVNSDSVPLGVAKVLMEGKVRWQG